jgi:hypothetical protein
MAALGSPRSRVSDDEMTMPGWGEKAAHDLDRPRLDSPIAVGRSPVAGTAAL